MNKAKYPVQATNRTFDILEVIQELSGANLSDITEQVDIGASAVHNHLTTLIDRGYVTKDQKEYNIGLSFLGLGAYARNQTPIYGIARPELDKLADKTGELTSLLVEKNGVGIYLYQSKGENAIELDTHLGKQVYLHCTALGKAILGFRSDKEVLDLLSNSGMPQITRNTITDQDTFLDELSEVRKRKYAIDQEERLNGLRCISAPITNVDNRSIAAISVSCPVHRIDDEYFFEELPSQVLDAANVIEIKQTYSY